MSERCEGKAHAVRLYFEGGLGLIVNLLHPSDGCSDLSEDGECVLTDWVENVQDDLLQGEITLPIRVEWITEDEPALHLLHPPSHEEKLREALKRIADRENWGGRAEYPGAPWLCDETPFEIARAALREETS